MAKERGTTWPIEPHTKAKHEILRRYWQAWLPIITKLGSRVLYIDGFAGPGRYEGGEDGSPDMPGARHLRCPEGPDRPGQPAKARRYRARVSANAASVASGS